jgi:hypothetical protein
MREWRRLNPDKVKAQQARRDRRAALENIESVERVTDTVSIVRTKDGREITMVSEKVTT